MNKEIVDIAKKENLTYLEALHALKLGGEVEFSVGCKIWNNLSKYENISRLLDDDIKFRIKQNKREVVVNGKKFYAEVCRLEWEQQYYIPNLTNYNYFEGLLWSDISRDYRFLERGIIFLNKEDAIGYAKACLCLE